LHSNPRRFGDWAVLVGLALAFLCLDQMTKVLVRQNLAIGEAWAPIPALAKVFTFTRVQNTGVAFGQMPGLGWLFMLVNLAVLVAVVVYYPRIPAGQWPLRLAAALILAGDLGNLIDRLRTAFFVAQQTGDIWRALPRASVTDFLDFKIWPVFNVADLCAVSGVAIVAFMLWQSERAASAEAVTKDDGQVATDRDV
jgi:signal peptidase II